MNYEINLAPFREPRGFIKLLEWFFAICAFATTVSFTTEFGFSVKCENGNTFPISAKVEYPFEVDSLTPVSFTQNCSAVKNESESYYKVMFLGNSRSDAEYFVCTGVLSFLYAIIGGVLYLLWEKVYQSNEKAPVVDFVVTLILAIFWISAIAAWSKGLESLKFATDPMNVHKESASAHHIAHHKQDFPAILEGSLINPSYSKLVVSILFGVINFVLWSGNLWFLYKETTWFESIVKHTLTRQTNLGSSNY